MSNQFIRSELLLGSDSTKKLALSHVAVFGIGGVGGYVVEALSRSGVGSIDLIDSDKFTLTNLNRQLHATHKTIGQYKVDVAAQRILDINPKAKVNVYKTFFTPETADEFDFAKYDYIVDAIDTVTGKIELVVRATACGTPIISCMGAGNKLNPTAFEVADIYATSVCPLAKVMRRELKKRGIKKLKVVYSKEPPLSPIESVQAKMALTEDGQTGSRRQTPGSTAFVPAVAGLIIASEVIKDLCSQQNMHGEKL